MSGTELPGAAALLQEGASVPSPSPQPPTPYSGAKHLLRAVGSVCCPRRPAMSILVCLIISAPVMWVGPLWCGVLGLQVPSRRDIRDVGVGFGSLLACGCSEQKCSLRNTPPQPQDPPLQPQDGLGEGVSFLSTRIQSPLMPGPPAVLSWAAVAAWE